MSKTNLVPVNISEDVPESSNSQASLQNHSGNVEAQLARLHQIAMFAMVCSGTGGIIILIIGAVYTAQPGPTVYQNWFTPIYFSACLIFEAFQLLLLLRDHTCLSTSLVYRVSRWTYWTVVFIASFMTFVCYAIRSLTASTVCELLAFLAAAVALSLFWARRKKLQSDTRSRWYIKVAKGLNVLLKFVHTLFTILFACGGIVLCLQYRYANFGKLYMVQFTNGYTGSINTYCTSPTSLNGTTSPTIWLDSSVAHGTTDFLGVQTYLAAVYGRGSCSHDPPGFGWSDPAPKDFTNTSQYFLPLVEKMGLAEEQLIYVGWGDGSQESIMHVLEKPETAAGLVLMDTSPDGIEFEDMARNKSWNQEQMLSYRKDVLQGRVSLAQLLLTLGFSWGLTPIFIPTTLPTEYFSPSLAARHTAQARKTSFWTSQYYGLLAQEKAAAPSTFLVDVTVQEIIPVYGILSRNPNPADKASNLFQRAQKLDLLNHVAGGDLRGLTWCEGDCNLGFPVNQARWTADALAALLS